MSYLGGPMMSEYQDWETPQTFVNWIEEKFDVWFDWDVCASNDNAKTLKWYTKEDNALNLDWDGVCWMNPPYNNQKEWVNKAINEIKQRNARQVWALLPARTDTRLFHDIIIPNAKAIYFIKGRISFRRGKIANGSTHPSMLVSFFDSYPQSIDAEINVLDVPKDVRGGKW